MINQQQGQKPQKAQGKNKSGSKQDGNIVKGRRALNGGVRRGVSAKPGHKTTNPGSGFK
jgi:hypothetical protein